MGGSVGSVSPPTPPGGVRGRPTQPRNRTPSTTINNNTQHVLLFCVGTRVIWPIHTHILVCWHAYRRVLEWHYLGPEGHARAWDLGALVRGPRAGGPRAAGPSMASTSGQDPRGWADTHQMEEILQTPSDPFPDPFSGPLLRTPSQTPSQTPFPDPFPDPFSRPLSRPLPDPIPSPGKGCGTHHAL